MKNKVTLLNIATSLLLQVVSLISGLIVPRIILGCFGSNQNGLIASISQFLSYITLIEGGITGVISAKLYKPLVDGDMGKLSAVMTTARSFYRKIGWITMAYTLILALVYPLVVNTGEDYWFVFALTIVLAVGMWLQYMFSLTMTTLLNADKKVYVVSITSIVMTIGNIALVLLVTKTWPNLLVLKIAGAAWFALQPVVYGLFIRKHYQLDWTVPPDNTLIKERWNGFAINLAFFIHISTDITILTLMADLKTVSVYSMYSVVLAKISVLIHSISSGIEPSLGQAYARNDLRELHEKLDLYEFIIFFSVGFLFTVMAMLITPFVVLYTSGVNDANYNQPLFGVMLVLAEAVYLLKAPHVSLAYAANKFKDITIPAYIEAAINIIVSIVLVRWIGLTGVAAGTLAAMLFRSGWHIWYTGQMIPSRKPMIFCRKLLIMTIATAAGVLICIFLIPIRELTWTTWLTHAVFYSLVLGALYAAAAGLFFRKELRFFRAYLKQKG